MRRCPACQQTYDDGIRFCRVDGVPLVGDGGETSENAATLRLKGHRGTGGAGVRTVPFDARTETAKATGGMPAAAAAPTGVLGAGRQGAATRPLRSSRARAFAVAALVVAAAAAAFVYNRSTSRRDSAIDSVAVLPFVSVGSDPDAEYLSEGISENLINSLSQLPRVKVIARSSSFRFRGPDVDPREAAGSLGVRAVVTGRIVQVADRLQVSAELVDAAENRQVWGGQYVSAASDLLAVQSEISGRIAEGLRLRLTEGERRQIVRTETASPEAYELELKGRYLWRKGGVENWEKAVEFYEAAAAADPDFALAQTRLSASYKSLAANSVLDPREYMPKAEAAARRALELDEGLAEAHLALANLQTDAWDWAAAERTFRRAVELNPNLANARNGYSAYLSVTGRHEEAVAEIRRARELDPLSLIVCANVGYRLYFARRYDEAIAELKKALELEPSYNLTHILLGYAYAAKGMYADAVSAYEEAIRSGGDSPGTQIYLGAAYAGAGDKERARSILRRLEGGGKYVSPAELAILYAALGERERAIASLERAFAARDLQLQYLKVDPAFDALRSDARFRDLIRRVGLP